MILEQVEVPDLKSLQTYLLCARIRTGLWKVMVEIYPFSGPKWGFCLAHESAAFSEKRNKLVSMSRYRTYPTRPTEHAPIIQVLIWLFLYALFFPAILEHFVPSRMFAALTTFWGLNLTMHSANIEAFEKSRLL